MIATSPSPAPMDVFILPPAAAAPQADNTRLAKATKSSEADGLELYRTGFKLFSQDGAIPRGLQERMISLQRKVLNVEKDVPPESVYDFSFVRAGNKELGKGESS